MEAEKYDGGFVSAEGRNEEQRRTKAGKRTEVGGGQWQKVLDVLAPVSSAANGAGGSGCRLDLHRTASGFSTES